MPRARRNPCHRLVSPCSPSHSRSRAQPSGAVRQPESDRWIPRGRNRPKRIVNRWAEWLRVVERNRREQRLWSKFLRSYASDRGRTASPPSRVDPGSHIPGSLVVSPWSSPVTATSGYIRPGGTSTAMPESSQGEPTQQLESEQHVSQPPGGRHIEPEGGDRDGQRDRAHDTVVPGARGRRPDRLPLAADVDGDDGSDTRPEDTGGSGAKRASPAVRRYSGPAGRRVLCTTRWTV